HPTEQETTSPTTGFVLEPRAVELLEGSAVGLRVRLALIKQLQRSFAATRSSSHASSFLLNVRGYVSEETRQGRGEMEVIPSSIRVINPVHSKNDCGSRQLREQVRHFNCGESD